MTTFDRYLLSRFVHVYAVVFVSTFGLFVVIDGFTNVDNFQEGQQSTVMMLVKMGTYYAFQSSLFFQMIGSIISVIATMVVFALLHRHGEIHPILAAGIPTYRLLAPIVMGTILVSTALAVNQEVIIPRIANRLQSSRSEARGDKQWIEPVNDYKSGILIDGRQLQLSARRIEAAQFILPGPDVVRSLTTLKAQDAVFYSQSGKQPAGWLLRKVSPKFGELELTREGRRYVIATDKPDEIFVVTDISFDQLSSRSHSYQYVSTPELIRRIKNPSFGIVSVRSQALDLHRRLLRPLGDVLAVLIAVPLILRKESRGIVGNMALCTGVLSAIYLFAQASFYMAGANLIGTDLAVWLPLISSGALGVWIFGMIQL